jgi:hypothetical protein
MAAAARARQQEEAAFQRILIRLGLSEAAVQGIHIQTGITVTTDLANLEKKDIDDILKIV